MKKITALLLTVVMLMSMMCMTALATDANDFVSTAFSYEGGPGKIALVVTANKKTTNGLITINFDRDTLGFISAEVYGAVSSVSATDSSVTFGYTTQDLKAIYSGGTIATIYFTLDGNKNNANITVTVHDFNNQEGLTTPPTPGGDSVVGGGSNQGSTPNNPTFGGTGGSGGIGGGGIGIGGGIGGGSGNSGNDTPGTNAPVLFTDVAPGQWYYDAVQHVVYNGYFKGVSDDAFAPSNMMTRAMFVTVLGRIAGISENGTASGDFADVPAGQWFTNYVAWASENGIVQGTANGAFSPNANITREQMAVFLYRYAKYAGLDTSYDNTIASFSDAGKISSWAQEAMAWAVSKGIMNGTGTGLEPQANATRAQVAQIVFNFDSIMG